MKTKHLYSAGFLLIIGASACNNNGATGTTNPTDSTVTTTTTTTTVHRKYTGSFVPQPKTQYIDLKTNRQITVKIDTTLGAIVNTENNEPVDPFVEPITHDTIYGLTGTVVNNYVIHEPSGDVRVDTVRINTVETNSAAPDPDDKQTGKVKYKQNAEGTKSKYKDDDVKIKDKNGIITTKDR